MSDDFLAKNEGTSYTPPPEETYSAVCTGVFNLGMQQQMYMGKMKTLHQVYIMWELDHEKEDGSRHTIGRKYTLSLFEKAGFRKMLEAWFGTKITAEQEKKGIDPRKLLGKPCQIQVIHGHGSGANANKVYANVGAVLKLPAKGMEALKPKGELLSYTFNDNGLSIPTATPKYVVELIHKSSNWQVLQNQANRASDDSEDSEANFAPDDAVNKEEVPF